MWQNTSYVAQDALHDDIRVKIASQDGGNVYQRFGKGTRCAFGNLRVAQQFFGLFTFRNIAGNAFDGSGLSGADSWVDLKGNGYLIVDNHGKDAEAVEWKVTVETQAEISGSDFGAPAFLTSSVTW